MPISENSSRVAKNTILLFCRMLLLMLVGLYTSRVVLAALGFEDNGIWGLVGGIVSMFTVVTSSITQSISRYLTFELGRGDMKRMREVFSTSVVMQIFFCLVIVLLTETLGLWYLDNKAVLPAERMHAANVVLQCAMGILMVNLFSVPFNATIIAHEKMGAFAYISIVEAGMKLLVAFLLSVSTGDKLILYGFLMLGVAVVVRSIYSLYCRRHFDETRGRLVFKRSLLKEMTAFAGWNTLGSTGYLFNTQGINILTNAFFGVALNTSRSIAAQLESTVRQFVNSFTTALNPQITKSWASGNRKYCFELVFKGAKFSYLMILAFAVPLLIEPEIFLSFWLKDVPEYAVDFSRLVLIGTIADMLGNSMAYLELATGDIKKYYLIIGSFSFLAFGGSWLAFALGAGPVAAYVVFIAVYSVMFVLKIFILRAQVDFPAGEFAKEVLLRIAPVTAVALAFALLCSALMPANIWRLLAVIAASSIGIAASSWLFALTEGEKNFVKEKINGLLKRS